MEQEKITILKKEYEELLKKLELIGDSKIIETTENEINNNNQVPIITLVEESLSEIWNNEEDDRWNEC